MPFGAPADPISGLVVRCLWARGSDGWTGPDGTTKHLFRMEPVRPSFSPIGGIRAVTPENSIMGSPVLRGLLHFFLAKSYGGGSGGSPPFSTLDFVRIISRIVLIILIILLVIIIAIIMSSCPDVFKHISNRHSFNIWLMRICVLQGFAGGSS